MLLTACPPPVDKFEEQQKKLRNNSSPWVLAAGGVVKDGYDVSDQFSDFELTFGQDTYSAKNGVAVAWPATGTWEFHNDDINTILRDDVVVIDVALNGANTGLTLTFTITVLPAGGRIAGIPGKFIFNLASD